MEDITTDPYSPWKNKSEIVIRIINGKAKRRIFQSNISKRVWDFGMVWEAEIYPPTVGNDGNPSLERLTGDKIDISEWLQFYFYDLVWFWDNQSDDNKPMFLRWIGVSHRFLSDLCYCIISNKEKVLSRTTVQHPTADEPRDTNVQ